MATRTRKLRSHLRSSTPRSLDRQTVLQTYSRRILADCRMVGSNVDSRYQDEVTAALAAAIYGVPQEDAGANPDTVKGYDPRDRDRTLQVLRDEATRTVRRLADRDGVFLSLPDTDDTDDSPEGDGPAKGLAALAESAAMDYGQTVAESSGLVNVRHDPRTVWMAAAERTWAHRKLKDRRALRAAIVWTFTAATRADTGKQVQTAALYEGLARTWRISRPTLYRLAADADAGPTEEAAAHLLRCYRASDAAQVDRCRRARAAMRRHLIGPDVSAKTARKQPDLAFRTKPEEDAPVRTRTDRRIIRGAKRTRRK